MKRLIKVIVLLFLFVSVVGTIVFVRFQQIIKEEVSLTDERCLKINPIVIERKKAYLSSMQAMVTSGKEAFIEENKKYVNLLKRNVDVESDWSAKYKKLLNRWDFKLLIPPILQKTARLRWESHVYENETSKNMIALTESFFKDGNENNPKLKDASDNIEILAKQRNDVEVELETLANDTSLYKDFRIPLMRAPKSKCPEENFNIPDVQKELEKIFTPEASPSIPPVPNEIKN